MSNRMQAPHPPAEQNSSQAPAPVNLPPIHHFPPQHQQMQSQPPPYTTPMSSNGAPPPPQHVPPYPPPQYQYQNGGMPPAMQAGVAANGQNGMMRIPLPHAQLDSRQMSGGRHKKEIKRRTKTGCLTCRKRRIKCDEGQPTCRNCSKSKRECLGYDPIFKQQPGPANIQPAPIGNPASSATHPATGLSYHQPPQSFPGTGGTFIPASAPPGYEYSGGNAPLDPALSGGDPSAHMAHHNYPNALQPLRKVKLLHMEDLFALNDIPPRYNSREPPPPVSAATQQEMEQFFKYHYAMGLDRLFETNWYSQRGFVHLSRDRVLLDFVAQCAEQFKQRDDANAKSTISLEARLVWQLAMIPRTVAPQANGAGTDILLQEVLPRVDVVENLLNGQFLDPSRIPPPAQQQPLEPGQEPSSANLKHIERSFWHHLGRVASLRDDTQSVQKDIDDALSSLRAILNMLENRDVLYSVAIGRHLGGRMPDFHPQRQMVVSNNDPNDPVSKLIVAQQFVEQEEQRGTNQVIQRICSMAIRGWILQKR